jgi:hypothetical protein
MKSNRRGFFKWLGIGVAAVAVAPEIKPAPISQVVASVNEIRRVAEQSNLGMGDYIASNWVTPQIYADPNNSAMVVPPNGWGTENHLRDVDAYLAGGNQ